MNKTHFSFQTVHQIGIQLITLLEQFHSIGYIYNDLKPDNICIGEFNDMKTVHSLKLIDFGLATPYMKGNQHIKQEPKQFQGNLAFSSYNAFNEVTLSRRDDLISLLYLLLYLTSGKLPFVRHNVPLVDQIGRIKRKKNNLKPFQFCKEQNSEHFIDFAQYIYDLKFEEEPNYGFLRFMLQKNLMEKGSVPTKIFDWTINTQDDEDDDLSNKKYRNPMYKKRMKQLNLDAGFIRNLMHKKSNNDNISLESIDAT